MERRDLLTVTVQPFSATAGQPFSGTVATFTAENLQGTFADYSATIFWDNTGDTSVGTILPVPGQPATYMVTGSFTYPGPGPETVSVLITGADNSKDAGSRIVTVADAKLTVIGQNVAATAGVKFSGSVAQFYSANPSATAGNFTATITWGDGTAPTIGVVPTANPLGGFLVAGSHTYATAGTYTTTVTVQDTKGVTPFSGSATASVTGPAQVLTPFSQFVSATSGQPLPASTVIGSFTDSITNSPLSNFQAIITWGDGNITQGVVTKNSAKSTPTLTWYDVTGTNTYAVVGQYQPTIAVQDDSGDSTTIKSTAVVTNASTALVFTGALVSSPGVGLPGNTIDTNTGRPTFGGTAVPFSVIQLFARLDGIDATIPLGQTVAGPTGQWSLTVGPLLDGYYTVTAIVTSPGGYPTSPLPLANSGLVVVDTAPPVVDSVALKRNSNQVVVTFSDGLSGISLTSALNPANYAFVGPRGQMITPVSVALRSSGVLPTDPVSVVLTTTFNPRLRGRLTVLRIINSGITDLAGNQLAGSFRGIFAPLGRRVRV